MARMKFLCDADRCIECNACVTACKNENEVPWGINRRRVVTINDGKPGERSVSMACPARRRARVLLLEIASDSRCSPDEAMIGTSVMPHTTAAKKAMRLNYRTGRTLSYMDVTGGSKLTRNSSSVSGDGKLVA